MQRANPMKYVKEGLVTYLLAQKTSSLEILFPEIKDA